MNPDPNNDPVTAGLRELELRLYQSLIEQCRREHAAWLRDKLPAPPGSELSEWTDFLQIRIAEVIATIEQGRRLHAEFVRLMKGAAAIQDQQQIILNFARDLGATPEELKQDAAAFERWFGADAMTDRYLRRRARDEQYLVFLLERLAAIAAERARAFEQPARQLAFWKELKLEKVVKPLFVYDGDPRVERAAFRCLAGVLSALSPDLQDVAIDDNTLQYLYRSALEREQDVWIQCGALELLVTFSWVSFEYALRQRLTHPGSGDDLFVRRRAVQLLARHFSRVEGGDALVRTVLSDPNASVRQALPRLLSGVSAGVAISGFEHLVVKDPSPQVRAATWLEWPALLGNREFRDHLLRFFREVGPEETDEFVARVICLVAERGAEELRRRQDPFLLKWRLAARDVLLKLRCGAASVKVRRWASQSLEFVWTECDPEARALRERFADFIRDIPRGRSRRLPAAWTEGVDATFLGRVWSVVCRKDYDVQLQGGRGGYTVIRAHVFGFRWWRWWHEFRHPSPDKRQAFSHTIGRLFDGELHIPSGIMAELAQTKVPGEPLHISAEGGWRPYLPLPDELTSCVEFGRPTATFRIFTSEGITTVAPPRGWKRLRALIRLTWQFRLYAEKRNWLDTMQEPPSAYLAALTEMGFSIHFATYRDETGRPLPADPMVLRFFPEAAEENAATAAAPASETKPFAPATPEPVAHRLREQPDPT